MNEKIKAFLKQQKEIKIAQARKAGEIIPREDFREKAHIPKSTKNLVIIMPNQEAVGYKDEYNEQFLKGKVEKDVFQQTVQHISKNIQNIWIANKLQESKEYYSKQRKFIDLIFVILGISFFLILLNFGNNIGDFILWPCTIILIISGISIIFLILLSMSKIPIFTTFEEVGEKEIQKLLTEQNQNYYLKNGLEWKAGPRFIYLELHILSKTQQQQSQNMNLNKSLQYNQF